MGGWLGRQGAAHGKTFPVTCHLRKNKRSPAYVAGVLRYDWFGWFDELHQGRKEGFGIALPTAAGSQTDTTTNKRHADMDRRAIRTLLCHQGHLLRL